MDFEKLFTAGKIGSQEIKNRIVVTPVGLTYADSNGEAGSQLSAYLEERARGGAGIVMTGIVLVDSLTGAINPNELVLENKAQSMALARLARRIHKYGAKLYVQLYHPGKSTNSSNLGGESAWSASANPTANGELTKEMSKEDIAYLVERFAKSAAWAKLAGVDGVEIHAAHGYLLGQFLTPLFNHRTDEYGGDLENRTRIVRDIYQAVRKTVGKDYTVGIRVSADEFIDGGNTLEAGVKMAEMWDCMGVDYINVNCGLQESSQFNREPPSFPQGWKRHLAKAVKEAVKCPVIAVNTVKKPDFAESLLAEGVCDFVGLSRGHLADPHWTEKTRRGQADEIRICISCLNCMETFIKGIPPTCSVNPRLGREEEFGRLNRNGGGRPVAVVGGGPAGMEAAALLSDRGFDVTLYEQAGQLGGQLRLAEMPPAKEKISWLRQNMEAGLRRRGVKIRLGVGDVLTELETLQPAGVFCCTGSSPVRLESIPGIHSAHVYTVPEVLGGETELYNQPVAIIGTGLAGLETGTFLVKQGCRITFIEMKDVVGDGVFPQVLADEKSHFSENMVSFHTGLRLTAVEEEQLRCVDNAGKERCFAADAVVLAMGTKPENQLAATLRQQFGLVVEAGDCLRAGKIIDAVTAAYEQAWVFEP